MRSNWSVAVAILIATKRTIETSAKLAQISFRSLAPLVNEERNGS